MKGFNQSNGFNCTLKPPAFDNPANYVLIGRYCFLGFYSEH